MYVGNNHLVSFLKENSDTFTVLDAAADEGGKAQVLLLRSEEGSGDSTEPPSAQAGGGKDANFGVSSSLCPSLPLPLSVWVSLCGWVRVLLLPPCPKTDAQSLPLPTCVTLDPSTGSIDNLQTPQKSTSQGSGSPTAQGSDPELEEVLRLSLEQSKQSGVSSSSDLAPANGMALPDGTTAAGGGGKGSPSSEAVPAGVVDALASEKHGRWFSFDDRKVRARGYGRIGIYTGQVGCAL